MLEHSWKAGKTLNFYTKQAKQMHFLMLLNTSLTAKDFVLIAYINTVAATADAFISISHHMFWSLI